MTAACFHKTMGNVKSKASSFKAVMEGYDSFITNFQYNLRLALQLNSTPLIQQLRNSFKKGIRFFQLFQSLSSFVFLGLSIF